MNNKQILLAGLSVLAVGALYHLYMMNDKTKKQLAIANQKLDFLIQQDDCGEKQTESLEKWLESKAPIGFSEHRASS